MGPCPRPSAVNDTLLPSAAYYKMQMGDNSQQNDVLVKAKAEPRFRDRGPGR